MPPALQIAGLLLLALGVVELLPGIAILGLSLLVAGGFILASAYALRAFLVRNGRSAGQGESRTLPDEELPEAIREIMQVDSASESEGVQVFRGRLRGSAGAVYERLKWSFSGRKVPLMQEDQQSGTAIVLLPPAAPAAISTANPYR
jgi:hypothetical protein